ncbi:UNVERIFIED_CONTAM: hypothetical protein GTU68_034722, partial [Idotea baltica]|nr:hypothetical protein [Idotea baltica]
SSSSVFYNPFKKEQEAKKSVLEKHVKLTTNPKDVLEINGKKICWNYRKGRCKFGHKCKYAHDSDLIGTGSAQNKSSQNSTLNDTYDMPEDIMIQSETEELRKRKPGLAEGLIPNKRSRKMYKDTKFKEAPWLNKR